MAESTPKRSPQKRLTFEEAFGRLEESVQALEGGGLTLAEATHLYEEGMGLASMCNELLSATELRVTRLQTSFGEQMHLLSGEEPTEESGEASDYAENHPSEDGASEAATEKSN